MILSFILLTYDIIWLMKIVCKTDHIIVEDNAKEIIEKNNKTRSK